MLYHFNESVSRVNNLHAQLPGTEYNTRLMHNAAVVGAQMVTGLRTLAERHDIAAGEARRPDEEGHFGLVGVEQHGGLSARGAPLLQSREQPAQRLRLSGSVAAPPGQLSAPLFFSLSANRPHPLALLARPGCTDASSA